MSVLDNSQMGASLSVRNMLRRGSQLSIFGISRLGSSLSLLDMAHLGNELSIRSLTMMGSDMRIEGTGGDLGFDVKEPLKVQGACRIGSSFSVFGRVQFAASLSVVDFLHLGASVSLRSFARLSSAVSVLNFSHLGSSLSLRGFCRIGSAISLRGIGRIGSHLSVRDCLCVTTDALLQMPSWNIRWDSGASELQFKTGTAKPIALTATGGSLHGTWMSESIISASDRRLKREVRPLLESLRGTTSQLAGRQKTQAQKGVASLLETLVPSDEASADDGRPDLRLEASDKAAEALPGVVREAAGKRGISYQDLIAVITMAAKERQQRLDALEEQEAAENAQYSEQEDLIQVLLQQVKDLSSRFTRLRYRHPRPPQWPPPKP